MPVSSDRVRVCACLLCGLVLFACSDDATPSPDAATSPEDADAGGGSDASSATEPDASHAVLDAATDAASDTGDAGDAGATRMDAAADADADAADDAATADAASSDGGGDAAGGDAGTDAAGPAPSPGASTQLAAVRDGTPGRIDGAAVTYLRNAIGDDAAGFYLQAEPLGPAVFVAVDPATLGVALAVGDLVSLRADTVTPVAGVPTVSSLSDLTVIASGYDVGLLVQDVSDATDLVSALDDYRSEYVTVHGTVAGAFIGSGARFVEAPLDTAGVVGNADLTLRLPEALQDALALEAGCELTVGPTPLGSYQSAAEPQVLDASELHDVSCPGPVVARAYASTTTEVRVALNRAVDPASVLADGSQFLIAGLTVSAATTDGGVLVLTTTAQTPGQTYTVVAAASVVDLFGGAIAGSGNSADFFGYEAPANVVINEINATITGGCDLVELRVVEGGSLRGFSFEERGAPVFTFGALDVATNDVVVLHFNAGNAGCNGSGHGDESSAVDELVGGGNYDTAWDVWSDDSGLTSTNNVFAVRGVDGAFVDAVLVANDGVCSGYNSATASESAAAEVAAAGQWVRLGGGVPDGGFVDDAFCESAVADLDATGTTAASGTTLQRAGNGDSNTRGDWSDAQAPSFGLLNVGQTAL